MDPRQLERRFGSSGTIHGARVKIGPCLLSSKEMTNLVVGVEVLCMVSRRVRWCGRRADQFRPNDLSG